MNRDREHLHGHAGPQNPSRRRRRPLSCIVCRRRKLKCDRSLPCAQCIKSKTAGSCTYAEDQRGSAATSPLRSRLQMASNRATPSASGVYVFDSRHKSPSNRVPKQSEPSELQELRNRVESLENALSLPGTILTPDTTGGVEGSNIRPQLTAEDEIVRENIDAIPGIYFRGRNSRTRFVGRCHWTLSISFFRDIGKFLEHHHKSSTKDASAKAMKRFKVELWSRERLNHQRAYQEQAFRLEDLLPPRAVADELLRLYLTTFETTYRILHVDHFLREYEVYWSGAQPADPLFLAKLLSLMAASSCFYNRTTGVDGKHSIHDLSTSWTMGVRSWIESVFVSPNIDFHMLQVKCLLVIACQANAVDGDVVWISSGSLVRSAMTMGLHRDMAPLENMTKFWAEMRRRLWATICELELESSLDGGMLPSIDLDECDCGYPSDWDDKELTENMVDYPAPKGVGQLTRNTFQVLLSRSLPVRFRVVKLLNSLKFSLTYDEALRLSEELVRSMNEVVSLYCNGGSIASVPGIEDTRFAKSFLVFLIRKYLLVLHQPFFVNVLRSPKFAYSRKVCLESALEMHSQLEPLPPGTPDTMLFGALRAGMLRNELFRAAATLCVEMSLQADEFQQSMLSRPGGMNHRSSFTDMVRSQQSAMLGTVERTIDMFGSLISPEGKGSKEFLFLTMVLASVKARLSGEEPLRSVEAAAAGALSHCKALMNMPSTERQPDGKSRSLETSLPTGAVDIPPPGEIDPLHVTGSLPFEFGNLFDMYDYGMPELWEGGLFTGL